MSAQREFARNQSAMARALDVLASYLGPNAQTPGAAPQSWEAPPALAHLADRLRLSRFEQELLLLAAAPDLDPRFRQLLTRAHGTPWPTLGLALARLPQPEWAALTPAGRLRGWHLLELSGAGSAFEARLVADEAILHRLAGCPYPDPRLEPWFRALDGEGGAAPAHPAVATAIIAAIKAEWECAPSLALAPLVRVPNGDGAFVRALANSLRLRPYRLSSLALTTSVAEHARLARLWEREALLTGSLLWVDADSVPAPELPLVADFLDRLQGLVVITGAQPWPLRRVQRQHELPGATLEVRLAAWETALGGNAARLNGQLAPLAEQFALDPAAIGRIAASVTDVANAADADVLGQALWNASRIEARRGLDQLATRVESRAGWDDLVLPEGALGALRTIAAQVRQRARVYREWGFGMMGERGLGIGALFAGGSGTGKTLAAEVLANDLQLDLYRIDLSALVSKYIGETEKHLARVFDAAEASGAILLFDEADALFGKRSEVRDSHDRYANLEVSYLLQRLETYRGLAILTTNLKPAIDTAFLRRLRFVLHFPFPDAPARAAIWQRAFPPAAPTAALDIGKLARLSLSGGHIRNMALNAAFLAADAGDAAVSMRHLRLAAQAEFAKLEQQLARDDVGDWA